MADLETLLRDVFGESFDRVSGFRTEQVKKIEGKIQEIAREGMKDEINRLSAEIADLRRRVATLEAERVDDAAESV